MTETIKLWGIKGSCPGASPIEQKYGANTSCIEISDADELIILDAGSGLIFLGQEERDFSSYKQISIFISHYHYDHIIGLPFFKHAYNPSLTFHIYGPKHSSGGVESAIKGLFVSPYLPMPFEAMGAKFIFHDLDSGETVSTHRHQVKTFKTDHPGGNLAYQVLSGEKTFSYITDLGHSDALHRDLVEFCKNSCFIYYDANFTDDEYFHSKYEGWGHSTHTRGYQLLIESRSHILLLGHHALHRGSNELDEIQNQYDAHHIVVTKDFMTFNWEEEYPHEHFK